MIAGTHEGRLSIEARERRADKNARNRARSHPQGQEHHLDMPVRGSARWRTRLWLVGNLAKRGGR